MTCHHHNQNLVIMIILVFVGWFLVCFFSCIIMSCMFQFNLHSSSRSFFNSHVSVFLFNPIQIVFPLLFSLTYDYRCHLPPFLCLLRRRPRCHLWSHPSHHQFKRYHQLWKGWCRSLITSLVWIVKKNCIQFIAIFCLNMIFIFSTFSCIENIFSFL